MVTNRKAGSMLGQDPEQVRSRLRQMFADNGIAADVRFVDGADASEAARQALLAGVDGVIAAGGDGTVGCVAGVLVDTGVALGVLPLGTFNHFARDLRLPPELDRAIGVIGLGQLRAVDAAEVNRRVFINNSSIGAYPRAVAEREAQRKQTGLSRPVAMLLSILKTLWRRPLMRVQLRIDDQSTSRTTPFVFVGNNHYSLDLFADARRTELDAGHLCVMAARSGGPWVLLRLAWQALFNQLHLSRDFNLWIAERVEIQTQRRSIRVALDGEVIRLQPPLRYRLRPRALLVFAPP